ncbi:MAG TPA: hypothetical protein DCZ23_00655 [Lachnospiraceae bacterium]|nr:hypothetical protein [Lachnospiraceae bacterium]
MLLIFVPIITFCSWPHFIKAFLAIDTTLYLCPFILMLPGIFAFVIFFFALTTLTVLFCLLLFIILYVIPDFVYFLPGSG